MSNTKRTQIEYREHPYPKEEVLWAGNTSYRFENKEGRDGKPWYKPNSSFKKDRRQGRRAKEKQFMKLLNNNHELFDNSCPPIFRKGDSWDWN